MTTDSTTAVDYSTFIKGDSPEEIAENVEKLRAILNPIPKATDRTQGHGLAAGHADDLTDYVLQRINGY